MTFSPAKKAKPPAGLCEVGRAAWKRLAREYDLSLAAELAVSYCRIEAEEQKAMVCYDEALTSADHSAAKIYADVLDIQRRRKSDILSRLTRRVRP